MSTIKLHHDWLLTEDEYPGRWAVKTLTAQRQIQRIRAHKEFLQTIWSWLIVVGAKESHDG